MAVYVNVLVYILLSKMLHPYHNVIWMSQGAKYSFVLQYCLTDVSGP